jgi:glycosyltransferase involved in cell wall biosynthesis
VSSSTPDVSVVIPCYRQAQFVRDALDSVAAQTFRGRVEVIVVDDGCPEGSGDVAAAHPSRPIVVRQTNRGVAGARNRGIQEARGARIAFLDADDRWYPEKLSRQVERMQRHGAGALCFTRYGRVSAQSGELKSTTPGADLAPSFRRLVRVNFVGCSTVLVDRECLDQSGGFPESAALARGGQDYALWLRIAARCPLLFVPEVLVDYRVHEQSRVGLDPVKNFEGAVHALRAFRDWSTHQQASVPRIRYRALVLRQFLHTWSTLGAVAPGITSRSRALGSLFEALCG